MEAIARSIAVLRVITSENWALWRTQAATTARFPRPPTVPYGYHDANGTLTPKNARGDYYVDDPRTGTRSFFDKHGNPITAAQFSDKNAKDPQDAGIATDEQQSGRAADAVRQLHQEMAHRYSHISDADAKLSEVLLNAHATTADGQQKLQAIQHKIGAINDPAMHWTSPQANRRS
jgi:hypothetical protein